MLEQTSPWFKRRSLQARCSPKSSLSALVLGKLASFPCHRPYLMFVRGDVHKYGPLAPSNGKPGAHPTAFGREGDTSATVHPFADLLSSCSLLLSLSCQTLVCLTAHGMLREFIQRMLKDSLSEAGSRHLPSCKAALTPAGKVSIWDPVSHQNPFGYNCSLPC